MRLLKSLTIPLVLLIAVSVIAGGCSRAFYRRRADTDAYRLVAEKSGNPHWPLENYSIEIDPRSRMFDPFLPDRPPMPPDDPTSNQLMQRIDGKRAFPYRLVDGQTEIVENPIWVGATPVDESGRVVLNSDSAVRLALLHSRSFQQELEDLYLSALDVSFERFRLDTQFFAGYETTYNADGPLRRAGASGLETGGDSSSLLTTRSFPAARGLRAERLGATGSTMVVGLANSLMWELSGPDSHTARTLLDFSIVQPLLRGAGRDVILERLTIAERTLLANVRQMERFRRGFYVEVMTGVDAGAGPSRRGGVFGSGLEGFTGFGSGGFGSLGGGGQGGAGVGGTTGAGAQGAGGFMGLVQTQQQIRNLEYNVKGLRRNIYSLEEEASASRERVQVDPNTQRVRVTPILTADLQVAQARQALRNAESTLVNTQGNFASRIDTYLISLGLPPDVPVEIDDTIFDQLSPFSQEIEDQQDAAFELKLEIAEINNSILDLTETILLPDGSTARTLTWSDELEQSLKDLIDRIDRVRALVAGVLTESVPQTRADVQRLEEVLPRRRQYLQQLQQKYACDSSALSPLLPVPRLDPEIFSPDRLDTLLKDLQEELTETPPKDAAGRTRINLNTSLNNLARRVAALQQRLVEVLQDSKAREETAGRPKSQQLADEIENELLQEINVILRGKLSSGENEGEDDELIHDGLEDELFALQIVQTQARVEAVELVWVDLNPPAALAAAREYRRDWMNARATLTDTWRLIRFNANALESGLDVVFEGDMSNTGDNPLRLRAPAGRLRVGLQFDAPLTRLSERNTYRQALIEYQQARRSFYAFEDGVLTTLRGTLRTIFANQLNFELRRFALQQAAVQISLNTRIGLRRPIEDAQQSPTAARDVVSAFSDLLNAQNDFLSVYVNYEVLRRVLDFNTGLMQLDPDGVWLDPGPIDGPGMCEMLNDAGPPLRFEVDEMLPRDGAAPEELPPPLQFEQDVPLLPPDPDSVQQIPRPTGRTIGGKTLLEDIQPPLALPIIGESITLESRPATLRANPSVDRNEESSRLPLLQPIKRTSGETRKAIGDFPSNPLR